MRNSRFPDGSSIKAVNSRPKSDTEAQPKKLVEKIDRAAQHYLQRLDALDAQEDQNDTTTQRESFQAKLESIRNSQDRFGTLLKESKENDSGQINLTDPDAWQLHKRGQTTVGNNVQITVEDQHLLLAACEIVSDGNNLGQINPIAQKAKATLACP